MCNFAVLIHQEQNSTLATSPMKSLENIKYCIVATVVMLIFTACNMDTPYSHYETMPMDGWEKNDTVTFDVPPIVRPGFYATTLGMRVHGSFPFKSITIVVEQTVFPSKKSGKIEVDRDTVNMRLTDNDGTMTGNGSNLYQYDMELGLNPNLKPGDSIHYAVRHIMKRSILPGVSDLGLTLRRK